MRVIGALLFLFITWMSYSQVSGEGPLDTTQIPAANLVVFTDDSTHRQVPRNVIYGEYNVLYLYATYERLVPLSQHITGVAGAGLGLGLALGGYGEYPGIAFVKSSLLLGGPKNYL